jgi:hypothetical protein
MQRYKILQRLQVILDSGPWQSKSEFCDSVGITPQILANLFHQDSKREIPKSLLVGLARLNFNITWFLFGVGSIKNFTDPQEEVRELRKQIDILTKLVDISRLQNDGTDRNREISIYRQNGTGGADAL